jgi:hypothetical protein
VDASDRTALLKARLSLALVGRPPNDALVGDLRRFLNDDQFELMEVPEALDTLGAATYDPEDVDLLRADAIMDVYRRYPDEGDARLPEEVRVALGHVADGIVRGVEPGADAAVPTTDLLLDRLKDAAAAAKTKADRWKILANDVEVPEALREAPHPDCEGGTVPFGAGGPNELVAKITTTFRLPKKDLSIDAMARNLVPSRWPECNPFFCSLDFRPDRANAVANGSSTELDAEVPAWAGVFHERVGNCDANGGEGSLRNIYLDVRWRRTRDLLCLTYDLLPTELPADVEVDKGHVIVEFGPETVEVSTEKYLRFADGSGFSDGFSLGTLACDMGWLDVVVNMVTCTPAAGGPIAAGQGVAPNLGRASGVPLPDLSGCADRARAAGDRLGGIIATARQASADGQRVDGAVALMAGLAIQGVQGTMGFGQEWLEIVRQSLGSSAPAGGRGGT